MSSNARYPRLDPDRIAGQSSPILEGLLRDQLKYEGVVITDSIEAKSVRATGSVEQIAVRSIRAGNDIVLTTGQGSWLRAYRALLAEADALEGVPGARASVRGARPGAASTLPRPVGHSSSPKRRVKQDFRSTCAGLTLLRVNEEEGRRADRRRGQ